jgi:phage shock protein A
LSVLSQAQDVAQLAISAVEVSEKARRKADDAAEELALARGARAALAGEVEELERQMAELPARQQLEAGTPVIATVLPSVESSGEVRPEPPQA